MNEIEVLDPATAGSWAHPTTSAAGCWLGRRGWCAQADQLARLGSLDVGKPIAEAQWDVAEAARILEYYAGWPTKAAGESFPVSADALSIVVYEPVGVVAAITPWNYPLLLAVQKIAPALAAGCSVILKPAEQTPLTSLRLPGRPHPLPRAHQSPARKAGAIGAYAAAAQCAYLSGDLDVTAEILTIARHRADELGIDLPRSSPCSAWTPACTPAPGAPTT